MTLLFVTSCPYCPLLSMKALNLIMTLFVYNLNNKHYSRVHISSDTAVFKILKKTIHSTEINTTSYEPPWCFSLRKNKNKFFELPNNQKLKN